MKTVKTLLMILNLFFVLPMAGQIQNGYVKTKGVLLPSGQVKPGNRVAGVTVTIRNVTNSVVSSGSMGTFKFIAPGAKFYLSGIQKKGYELADPEAITRPYSYSASVPLEIVLEDSEARRREMAETKISIRNMMNEQMRQKEKEIERLREQNRISEEQRMQLLEELEKRQESSSKLVGSMANYFVSTDYDNVSTVNQRINALILQGQLDEADSLIHWKGDKTQRVNEICDETVLLDEEVKRLNRNARELNAKRNVVASDLYSEYLIHLSRYENDSALYCLELRTKIDTTNVAWLLHAGICAEDYLSDYDKAMSYFNRAERAAASGNDVVGLVKTYLDMGALFFGRDFPQQSIEYYDKAQQLLLQVDSSECKFLRATIYENMGAAYGSLAKYNEAIGYYNKALDSYKLLYGENSEEVGLLYYNMGANYQSMKNLEKCSECFLKAYEILEPLLVEDDMVMSYIYNGLASLYRYDGDYQQAKDFYEKALNIRRKVYGEKHEGLAAVYNNFALLFQAQKEYDQAHYYLGLAEQIWKDVYGDQSPYLITLYGNEAMLYDEEGHYEEAVAMFEKSIDIAVFYFGKDSERTLILLPNMYITMNHLVKKSPTEENLLHLKDFLADKVVAMNVIEGGAAWEQGLRGTCTLLEYCGWTIDSHDCMFSLIESTVGKPKDVVAMSDGQIHRYHFDNKLGVGWVMRYVTTEERQQVIDVYNKWKQQQ